MAWLDVLNQVLTGVDADKLDRDERVAEVAREAPQASLAEALSHSLRSDQTAPAGDLVAQMFGGSSSTEKAGMLNQLLRSLGPAAATAILGGLLGRRAQAGGEAAGDDALPQLTPQQAEQVTPEQVRDVVAQAEQQQPQVLDQISDFYSRHASLIHTLGGAALVVALAKLKQNSQGR